MMFDDHLQVADHYPQDDALPDGVWEDDDEQLHRPDCPGWVEDPGYDPLECNGCYGDYE